MTTLYLKATLADVSPCRNALLADRIGCTGVRTRLSATLTPFSLAGGALRTAQPSALYSGVHEPLFTRDRSGQSTPLFEKAHPPQVLMAHSGR